MFWCSVFKLLSFCRAGSSCPLLLPIYVAYGSSSSADNLSFFIFWTFSKFLASRRHCVTDLTATIVPKPLLSPVICVSLRLLLLFLPDWAVSQWDSDLFIGLQTPFFYSFVPVYCLAQDWGSHGFCVLWEVISWRLQRASSLRESSHLYHPSHKSLVDDKVIVHYI